MALLGYVSVRLPQGKLPVSSSKAGLDLSMAVLHVHKRLKGCRPHSEALLLKTLNEL